MRLFLVALLTVYYTLFPSVQCADTSKLSSYHVIQPLLHYAGHYASHHPQAQSFHHSSNTFSHTDDKQLLEHRYVEYKLHLTVDSNDSNDDLVIPELLSSGPLHLLLERNERLIDVNYKEFTWHEGQLMESTEPAVSVGNHCFYHGHLSHSPETSRVALRLCNNQLNGVIMQRLNNSLKHTVIEWDDDGQRTLMYELEALEQPPRQCAHRHQQLYNHTRSNSSLSHSYTTTALSASTPLPTSMRRLLQATAPNTPMFVNILVVNDFPRFRDKQQDTQSTSANIINLADNFLQLNSEQPPLRMSLTAQITFTSNDPFAVQFNSAGEALVQPMLSAFLDWSTGLPNVNPYNQRTLISGEKFEENVVGLAPVGELCNDAQSGSIVQGLSFADINVANTVVHEFGHNIGMNHDGVFNSCPSTGFIMSAVSTINPNQFFSTCSLTEYSQWFNRNAQNMCLRTTPGPKYGTCKNGVIEGDEKCDCPDSNRTRCQQVDPCCNYETCQLFSGAQCSSVQPCCTQQCQFVPASANQICRAAVDAVCDMAEKCDGQQSSCPWDRYSAAGESCADGFGNGGKCYQAQCRSADRQCRSINPVFRQCPNNSLQQSPSVDPSPLQQCAQTLCNDDSNTCIKVSATQSKTPNGWAADGLPCSLNGATDMQCKSGQCVKSSKLDVVGVFSTQTNSGLITDILSHPTSQRNVIIIGCVTGSVGLLLLLFALSCCCQRKRKQKLQPPVRYLVAPVRTRHDDKIHVNEQRAIDMAVAASLNKQSVVSPGLPQHSAKRSLVDSMPGIRAAPKRSLPSLFKPRSAQQIEPQSARLSAIQRPVNTSSTRHSSLGPGRSPNGWGKYRTKEGKAYWFNVNTGESSWEQPI